MNETGALQKLTRAMEKIDVNITGDCQTCAGEGFTLCQYVSTHLLMIGCVVVERLSLSLSLSLSVCVCVCLPIRTVSTSTGLFFNAHVCVLCSTTPSHDRWCGGNKGKSMAIEFKVPTRQTAFLKCTACNDNGLMMCPDCMTQVSGSWAQ